MSAVHGHARQGAAVAATPVPHQHALGPILVATDFSTHARAATQRAARLAQETSSPLTLLHVLPRDALGGLLRWIGAPAITLDKRHAQAQRSLRAAAGELPVPARVQVRPHEAGSTALRAMLRTADAMGAGLMVLGAAGRSAWPRLWPESTSTRMTRQLRQPLLIVRRAPQGRYQRALVAIDGKSDAAPLLNAARRLARQAQLVLVTVYAAPFVEKLQLASVDAFTIAHYREQARAQAVRRLHHLAATHGLLPWQWQPCVVEGDAARCIVEQQRAQDCDLAVLGKDASSPTLDLMLGRITSRVLADSHADVLVVPRAAAR